MNWVSPIKDEETLERFRNALKEIDIKYYIMFEIGIGTGLQLKEILKFKNKDVRGKNRVNVLIGVKKIKRSFIITKNLKFLIHQFTDQKDPQDYLLTGHSGSFSALSREQAYRVFKAAGKSIGLNSIGAQTMRKTFAWRYYKDYHDIYYLQNLFNHASPSITYRYIGEKPNIQFLLKKLTPEENERSRQLLTTDHHGSFRLQAIIDSLLQINEKLTNTLANDSYYGKVECLLNELETLMNDYQASE